MLPSLGEYLTLVSEMWRIGSLDIWQKVRATYKKSLNLAYLSNLLLYSSLRHGPKVNI